MAYATVADVQARMLRTLSPAEESVCSALLDDAAVIIDAYAPDADPNAAELVSVRMVMRALGDGSQSGIPMGATQGSMTGLGYSQSWTIGSGGASGEIYMSRAERRMLGLGNRIGSRSPVEELVPS